MADEAGPRSGVDWTAERTRNGGLDIVPTATPGTLFLCGKHLIGPDPVAAVARCDDAHVVCLNRRFELADRYPDYVSFLDAAVVDGRATWEPIPDLGAPPPPRGHDLADAVAGTLRSGTSVLMHCGAGIGRAGTMAAATLMVLGHARTEAIEIVAASRPMAGPEHGAQTTFLFDLAARLT